MSINFTSWKLVIASLFLSQFVAAQAIGDYRSSRPNTGAGPNYLWSNTANWERWDGSTWVTTPDPPAPISTDGVISITAGDSIALNTAITIDQVHVETGASLTIFGNTITLNDVALEDDIVVDGKLYLGSLGILNGTGTVMVNGGGYMEIRNGGTLSVGTTNAGIMEFTTATINGATLTNNGTIRFLNAANVTLINGVVNNNATMDVLATTNVFFSSGAALTTNSVTNASGAILNRISSSGIFGTNNSFTGVSFSNAGTIEGSGAYSFATPGTSTFTNTGTISPGIPGATAILTSTNNVISATSTVQIEILNGTGAGSGNDQLAISTAGVKALAGTLEIIDNPTAPVGTYVILTTAGTFSGTFTTVIKPTNFSNPDYSINTQVSITKIALYPLPVIWGNFTSIAKNNQVQLNWTTLGESNTSHFVVEYSTNGRDFTNIATVPAKGNSSSTSAYTFTHPTPNLSSLNFYRLKEVDLDAKGVYSEIRTVRFTKGRVVPVLVTPNPVKGVLRLSVQLNDISITLSNQSGIQLNSWRLAAGVHQLNLRNLPAGVYQLTIYQNEQRIGSQQIIKQ